MTSTVEFIDLSQPEVVEFLTEELVELTVEGDTQVIGVSTGVIMIPTGVPTSAPDFTLIFDNQLV